MSYGWKSIYYSVRLKILCIILITSSILDPLKRSMTILAIFNNDLFSPTGQVDNLSNYLDKVNHTPDYDDLENHLIWVNVMITITLKDHRDKLK